MKNFPTVTRMAIDKQYTITEERLKEILMIPKDEEIHGISVLKYTDKKPIDIKIYTMKVEGSY